jgi:hypothetical protein
MIVDGSAVPLRRIETIRFVTPARDEHPPNVAARLGRSSRLAVDPTFPADSLVFWGDRQKLEELRSYRDVQNTRAAFQDPEGQLLVLTITFWSVATGFSGTSAATPLAAGVAGLMLSTNPR